METSELKFLLKLLGCPDYRSSLAGKTFDSFTGKDKICRDLGNQELIDYSCEIASVKILPPGSALLKIEPTQIPINNAELKVLERISKASGKLKPSEINVSSIKAADKEEILKNLSERGLIEIESKLKRTKAEVWLTERGIEYLRDDFNPSKGSNPVISLELLDNYIRFFRKNLRVQPQEVSAPPADKVEPASAKITDFINITDEEILQTIRNLDKELGTENYLPIFHLRQKLQPPLSRDELDKALYRLQANDQIELSTLLDPTPYTSEQFDAGISQTIGGALFFISVS